MTEPAPGAPRAGRCPVAAPAWAARRVRLLPLVDRRTRPAAAVHTGFGICALEPGGAVAGARALVRGERSTSSTASRSCRPPRARSRSARATTGCVPVGVAARLAQRTATSRPVGPRCSRPQPRAGYDEDTFAGAGAAARRRRSRSTSRDPRTRRFGHIEPAQHGRRPSRARTCSRCPASMRTALLVYSGITVKMMVDTDLGAQLTTMFMVQYDARRRGRTARPPVRGDVPVPRGRGRGGLRRRALRARPGDVACAGVGCVHGFRNAGDGPAALAGDPGAAAARPRTPTASPATGTTCGELTGGDMA